MPVEPIIDYLKRRLSEAGPSRWEAIAKQAKVAKSLPRKLAYADRKNPRLGTIQPLFDYFQAVDRGEKQLPWDGVERRQGGR